MIRFVDVIRSLRPRAKFAIGPNGLEWLDENQSSPTEEEINNKMAELQADYDSKQYQRDRAAAYPSWQDQLDNIFHNGIDAWKADIQAIKDQFPKP